jgi:hypothetical protein
MRSDQKGSADRLERLRMLVAKLERLPASTEQEWMLSEARARMVDVETGEVPRAFRPVDEAPPPDEAAEPIPKPAEAPPVKRLVKQRRPAAAAPADAAPSPSVDAGPDRQDRRDHEARPFDSIDGLLSLEDVPEDPPASADDHPWRRGLRG